MELPKPNAAKLRKEQKGVASDNRVQKLPQSLIESLKRLGLTESTLNGNSLEVGGCACRESVIESIVSTGGFAYAGQRISAFIKSCEGCT